MNNLFQMPAYRINEYRLIVPLPQVLQEKMHHLRICMHEKHAVKFPFDLKPGLTILRCHAFERIEPKLVERLQQVAMSHNPFKVEIKDFSAYPSHTIYADVLTKGPFHELVKNLRKAKWLMNIPDHEPYFITEPHLILAQRLKPKEFTRMWLDCEHRQFTGRFVADAMLLLKRSPINKRWTVLRRMEFMSLPMDVKQGQLFE
jgi:2'-5' RNA ligase